MALFPKELLFVKSPFKKLIPLENEIIMETHLYVWYMHK